MATLPPQEHDPKIVPLFPGQEQEEAEALARYWDARLQGQSSADTDLEPELRDMVQLLEHYREVTDPLSCVTLASDALSLPLRRQPGWVVALVVLAAAFLLFSSNTLLSPRSWLLSSAQDPDWIPWVSDDWLGGHAPAAGSVISQVVAP